MPNGPSLRSIPSVDKVLRDLGPVDLPRPAVVAVVRRALAAVRGERSGEFPPLPAGGQPAADILARIRSDLDALRAARLGPLLNGTGIIIHTNLGRSPLGPAVIETLTSLAANYNNLEYDLTGGRRGGRAAYVEHNLAVLCGAEAATVVNNCAAALVLILRHFCRPPRNHVIISRGELVQIGGGFRVPEILETSGAVLREIGTTNQTALDDYARALEAAGDATALILRVHRGNFYMGGFVESPAPEAIALLARERGIPFVEDLGSGATFRTEDIGVEATSESNGEDEDPAAAAQRLGHDRGQEREHEPTPAEVLKRGTDLVCFSGDKLLGGPQAGIIAGSAGHVAALKRDPFFRALRCDKLILSALQATVDLHLSEPSSAKTPDESAVPVLAMMRTPAAVLEARAKRLVAALADLPLRAAVGTGRAQVGGGSLPRTVIPSITLDLLPSPLSLEDFASRLRAGTPPVIGYLGGGRFKIDLRTIFLRQDETLLACLRAATVSPPT